MTTYPPVIMTTYYDYLPVIITTYYDYLPFIIIIIISIIMTYTD